MLELSLSVLTVIAIALIIYHHLLYPMLLRYLGRADEQASVFEELEAERALPSITLLIPAYNEEAYIADKIRNLSILDYPAQLLKVIIAIDGSTDGTYERALQALAEPECHAFSISLLPFEQNRGKVGVLNALIPEIDSDIVGLSDVSALISMDALLVAAAHFQRPKVAVVNGNYRLLNPGSDGERQYWNYQSRLKANESRLGSVIGSHGAFYLFRSELYEPLPADTINDDFVIPMRMVEKGYQSVYEPAINALELERASDDLDSQRRMRISAGNLQQVMRLKRLLSPRYGGTAFTFASGKFLRVFIPYLMIFVLLSSFVLAGDSLVFSVLLGLQLLVYAQYLLFGRSQNARLPAAINAVNYLIRGHVNGLLGSLRYLRFRSMRQLNLTQRIFTR